MKKLFILIILVSVAQLSIAQQWLGSNTPNSLIWRTGGGIILGGTTLQGSFGNGEGVLQLQSPPASYSFLSFRSNDGTGGGMDIGFSANSNGTIYTNQIPFSISTNYTQRLIVKTDGNVGIGTRLTTNPNNYKLAVNGTIGAKEVQVENTSTTWADYVFEPTYKLMSLQELQLYISINKHLPEIPSAEEVKTNGHKLGEMDVLLLKKVEELTLYIIELKNENAELVKRIETLESKR